jgi:hypothetical protein
MLAQIIPLINLIPVDIYIFNENGECVLKYPAAIIIALNPQNTTIFIYTREERTLPDNQKGIPINSICKLVII